MQFTHSIHRDLYDPRVRFLYSYTEADGEELAIRTRYNPPTCCCGCTGGCETKYRDERETQNEQKLEEML